MTTADPAVQRELEATRDFVSDPETKVAGITIDVQTPFALYAVRAAAPDRELELGHLLATAGWARMPRTRASGGKSKGRVAVFLSRTAWRGPDVPGHVTVTVSRRRGSVLGKPIATRAFTIHSGNTKRLVLPTPAGPYTVSVHIAPTFSPSQFGLADTRQLGATVQFAPVP